MIVKNKHHSLVERIPGEFNNFTVSLLLVRLLRLFMLETLL